MALNETTTAAPETFTDVDGPCPEGKTSVKVYTNEETPARMHWSKAVQYGLITFVAEYYVPMVADFACRSHVARIRAVHPDMALVYL